MNTTPIYFQRQQDFYFSFDLLCCMIPIVGVCFTLWIWALVYLIVRRSRGTTSDRRDDLS